MQTRALFLDRDGVINVNFGYVHRPENFIFIDGIFELANAAHNLNYKIFVITNQSGIARGYYSEQQFHQLSSWMCGQFLARGVPISKVFFSPYHPTEGRGAYRLDHISRKPHPGMLLEAQKEFNLDLLNSVLVGDKESDIRAGIAAGVGCNILFDSIVSADGIKSACQRVSRLRDALSFLKKETSSVVYK